jgi:hypothetical protein
VQNESADIRRLPPKHKACRDHDRSNRLGRVGTQRYDACMQYTIRQVPAIVDRALRKRAKSEGKSLNQLALEALAVGAGVARADGKPKRDLSFMRSRPEDVEDIRAAHEEFEQIDDELWR